MSYDTVSYQTIGGRVPFDEWLVDLSKSDRRAAIIIDARIARLRSGNFGNHRFVGNGVWELKIPFGPGYRVYYLLQSLTLVVLLLGGDKGEQERDILKARAYADDFRRRL